MQKIFGADDHELSIKYDELLTKLKNEISPSKRIKFFPLFRQQKEIEYALKGRLGALKAHFASFYGIYGLKISPNEFSSEEEYLKELAIQNRKLLTSETKKEYLKYLVQRLEDLELNNEFSGNLEYKVNRPMTAVFGVDLERAFVPESLAEKKQIALEIIKQELNKV